MKHTIDDVKSVNPEFRLYHNRIGLFNSHFQNFKQFGVPKAQLILTDVPYCYDEQTECFTKRGWLKYYELKDDDVVLTLNPKTREIEYSRIEQIIIRECHEPMYSFKSYNMDFLVTENHRMYCDRKVSTKTFGGKPIIKTIIGDIRMSQDMNTSCYIPHAGYKWQNRDAIENFVLPSCEINTPSNKHIEEKIIIKLEDWLPFFGLWLADGCTMRSKASNGRQLYSVSIKQAGEKREHVKEILNKLPFKYHEYKEKERNESNFNIYSKQLWTYLVQFGKSKEKFIPRWILDLSKEKLRIFWDGYTFGDSTKNGSGIKISSVSKSLIEGLQEIALKLGVVCQIRKQEYKQWPKPLYYFQFNENSKNAVFNKKKKIDDYKGFVWCVTCQKNGVFLVRRNGIINFCGNCIGKNAYGSNPVWYVGGDNKNGESELAGEEFFDTDKDFRPAEFMHFCSQMLRPEPKEKGKAPCMVIFCEFEQQFYFIELARRYGLNNYINLVFRKNYSAQVLKANMRVVGNCEYGLILYRDKLPKFNNGGGDDIQLHGVSEGIGYAEDARHAEAIVFAPEVDRIIHRPRRCGHRPLRREREHLGCCGRIAA